MYELTILVVGVVIGFVWGVWNTTHSMLAKLSEQPELFRGLLDRIESMKEAEQTTGDEQTQPVVVEWSGQSVYLYDSEGQFLAQANTVSDAMDAAQKRFPNMKFYIRLNDQKESAQ